MPCLTTGTVDYGNVNMEAFHNAVSLWGNLVAEAIVGSHLERTGATIRDCLRIGNHRVCPGGTAFLEQFRVQFLKNGNGSSMREY